MEKTEQEFKDALVGLLREIATTVEKHAVTCEDFSRAVDGLATVVPKEHRNQVLTIGACFKVMAAELGPLVAGTRRICDVLARGA